VRQNSARRFLSGFLSALRFAFMAQLREHARARPQRVAPAATVVAIPRRRTRRNTPDRDHCRLVDTIHERVTIP
jgi:hypothetical protein